MTGFNGYIGRHVMRALWDKGAEVIACDIACNDVDERVECRSFNLFDLLKVTYRKYGDATQINEILDYQNARK